MLYDLSSRFGFHAEDSGLTIEPIVVCHLPMFASRFLFCPNIRFHWMLLQYLFLILLIDLFVISTDSVLITKHDEKLVSDCSKLVNTLVDLIHDRF